MKDFLSRLHHQFVHVLDQGLNVLQANLCFQVFPRDQTSMLQALDVLSCNAHIDQLDLRADLFLRLLHSLLDGGDGAVNVGHYSSGDPHGFTSAVAQEFNFPKLVLASNEASDFGRSNVESDDDFVGVGVGLVLHHG